MPRDIEHEEKRWNGLSRLNPTWAVLAHEEKLDAPWSQEEFLSLGRKDVEGYRQFLSRHIGREPEFGRALDFGCGLGRLSSAWSPYCREVTGVDISSEMIDQARAMHRDIPNLKFVHNAVSNLGQFPDASFDLVFAHIVLQHIPSEFQQNYLVEFARICAPGGFIVFNLPYRFVPPSPLTAIKKQLIDRLPPTVRNLLRSWRRGPNGLIEMYPRSRENLEKLFQQRGYGLVAAADDFDAGENYACYRYIFSQTAAAAPSF